ncbi:diaminopimelate decarboxylase [Pseudobacteriovorax antillogorgiicola]|uniref:Diaminopimelate decarboxylase n=1 Tax=Pseudobacteriovorax antillogorgiicola TaxID=1513793 RepID=A0A1Y6C325_9BACT|nr:diaminopimelate decarboxylase [Pseudobacteriovorax antillogorgiicola]TCS50321.1 diaminopimelate decarboxylase [Pseudobacteriovorax antillogorgiicola]SMF34188.1 diaminopimelate decarboxylase [Pseudobacteriovorax antillogorgiicola]
MDHFIYKNGEAHCENIPLTEIAEAVGTPAYIYSRNTLKRHARRIIEAFSAYPTLACFAVKANSNLSFLREIFDEGFGADLVSHGELQRALKAGVKPHEIVFSGVGKKDYEIRAGIEAGILSFNVESSFELESINRIALDMGKMAPVCLRINPNIDAKTNPKIATGLFSTKFGMSEAEAKTLVTEIQELPGVQLVGIACHIGSQITDLKPLEEAAEKMSSIALEMLGNGHPLEFIDMGGGLGIRYKDEPDPDVEGYASVLIKHVQKTGLKLVIEPGRLLAGNTGILLNKVIGIKKTPQKNFAIVDGAMNDVIRPSLYDSFHDIATVHEGVDKPEVLYDVVGPVCETGDFFGKDRTLPQLHAGDLVFLKSCGAYAATMASNYNSRPRAPEVLVDGDKYYIIKPRETLEDLWRGEEVTIPGGE